MREVVIGRFRERLTLDSIAAVVESSPFRVCRLFRAATGSTIHRHLLRVAALRSEPAVRVSRPAVANRVGEWIHVT